MLHLFSIIVANNRVDFNTHNSILQITNEYSVVRNMKPTVYYNLMNPKSIIKTKLKTMTNVRKLFDESRQMI